MGRAAGTGPGAGAGTGAELDPDHEVRDSMLVAAWPDSRAGGPAASPAVCNRFRSPPGRREVRVAGDGLGYVAVAVLATVLGAWTFGRIRSVR